MYHVNELCLEEQTVTNGIAKFIDEKEKKNSKLMDDLKDEFHPDSENYLNFKPDSDAEDNGLGEMFEGDSADMCAGKFPLT
jgi:hypothetical protein